jgi:tripartite-type tricarboxylate transporter receptor subunit TctC
VLQQKLQTVVNDPELAKNLAGQAISISRKPVRELPEFLGRENEKYRAIITDAKISIK